MDSLIVDGFAKSRIFFPRVFLAKANVKEWAWEEREKIQAQR